ncbi:MAG: hypothetical protein U9N57_07085 [Pseudomonadota bacterium]|nr:hypothetical protein [Pseudomonadota bacterium]
MELTQILIGIFTAAILIFLRSANIHAQKQKIVSTRLNSYLRYWRRIVLDNDWFKVFYIGVQWNNEIKELVAKGGTAEDIVQLNDDKKELLIEFQEIIKTDSESLSSEVEKIRETFRKFPEPLMNSVVSLLTTSSQNIIEGKTFVSDADVSSLDPHIAAISIDLKMKMVNAMTKMTMLFLKIAEEPDDFKFEDYADEISELIWQAILVSKDIDTLSSEISRYSEKSVFALTIRNLWL